MRKCVDGKGWGASRGAADSFVRLSCALVREAESVWGRWSSAFLKYRTSLISFLPHCSLLPPPDLHRPKEPAAEPSVCSSRDAQPLTSRFGLSRAALEAPHPPARSSTFHAPAAACWPERGLTPNSEGGRSEGPCPGMGAACETPLSVDHLNDMLRQAGDRRVCVWRGPMTQGQVPAQSAAAGIRNFSTHSPLSSPLPGVEQGPRHRSVAGTTTHPTHTPARRDLCSLGPSNPRDAEAMVRDACTGGGLVPNAATLRTLDKIWAVHEQLHGQY